VTDTQARAGGHNLLATAAGRRWLFALLYLSEGAPIGFVWWAMPTLLRGQGVDLASITTLTSLATVPWVLKFLVAPVIDAGLHRAIPLKRWILVCQMTMAAALLPLALIDWSAEFQVVLAVVLIHAVFAAVQDVGIDTLAIHTVPSGELGRVNGWMQAGMLGGRAGVAAGSAMLAGAFGNPSVAVLALAVLIALPAIVLIVAVDEPRIAGSSLDPRRIARLVSSRAALAGIAIALLIGAGFEFFGVSAGPRLVDLGRSDATLATFFGLLAPAGLALGALAGGRLTDRVGPLAGTTASLFALTAVLSWIAAGDLLAVFPHLPLVSFTVAYLAIGALTASSYALFMTLSRGEFAATRFSVFMAMTNACEAWAGFVGGRFAVYSYGTTLLTLAVVACIALVPLYLLRKARREVLAQASHG
jgi:PAT family beta-lactamase induction signal transducer AmpG